MEPRPIEKITDELLHEFGDRKSKGRLDLVIDMETENIYPVPKRIEHKDFVPTLPNYAPRTSKFIPSQVHINNGEVIEILTGASSYEGEFDIKHPLKELFLAHKTIWTLVLKSGYPVNIQRNEVIKSYASN